MKQRPTATVRHTKFKKKRTFERNQRRFSAFFLSFFLVVCRLDCSLAIFMLGSSGLAEELLLAVVCMVLFESSGLDDDDDEELPSDDEEDVDVRLEEVMLEEDVGLSLWY